MMEYSGIYNLSSPSFIKKAKAIDHARGRYRYVISKDDHPDKTFTWVCQNIEDILTTTSREFPEYQVQIDFHPFEHNHMGDYLIQYCVLVVKGNICIVDSYLTQSFKRSIENRLKYRSITDLLYHVIK